MNLDRFLEQNRQRHLEELKEFLKIPSVSTLPEYHDNIWQAAEWLKKHLIEIGLKQVKTLPTEGNPIVYGEYLENSSKPTVLVYGHYDVQPAEPIEKWRTPPFTPTIKEGKLYARGASDNKGQIFTHLKAAEALIKNKALPVNVKFIIEGEEEIGGPSLQSFLEKNQKLLKADLCLISDGTWVAQDLPTIVTSLRGIVYLEILLTAFSRDLHSGIYGGNVDNPIQVLAFIINQLKNREGKILIPGIYDDVRPITKEERQELKRIPLTAEQIQEETSAFQLWGEKEFIPIERKGLRPSLDINGIWGGFSLKGSKTIIPSQAGAKISLRLAPKQKAEKVSQQVRNFIEKIVPQTVKLEIKVMVSSNPYECPQEHPGIRAAKTALQKAFGKEPILAPQGGSIPITEYLDRILGIKAILMDLGQPDDNLHAPNEKFNLDNFYQGIKASIYFLQGLTKFW